MSRSDRRQNIRPVQSVNIINPTNDIITKNQEDNTLIWFDSSMNLENEDIIKRKQALRSVNDYVLLFSDEKQCVNYIKSIDLTNIFLVVSGRSSATLLPQIHELKQVKKICVFCMNGELYKSLLDDYSKVIDICTEQEQLITCLKKALSSVRQIPSLISFMKNKAKQNTHLNAIHAYDFRRQQTIKNIILRIPRMQGSKQKMIDYCRSYYQGNETELAKIDAFAKDYESPAQATYFYTKDSFLYRIINHALRIQDLQLLEIFRFYINDLSETLTCGFEELKTTLASSEQKALTLYRGQLFPKEEYHRFLSCKYVTFNSFFAATSNINMANIFAGITDNQISSDADFVPALFQIEVDLASLNSDTVIVADISGSSQFTEECEYLFTFGSTFEVIGFDVDNQIIKMIVSDKPHHVSETLLNEAYKRKYASEETIHWTTYEPSLLENFAEPLFQIHKSLKRLDAFENYILKTSINDQNYQTGSQFCLNGYDLHPIDPNSLYARECRKHNPDYSYVDEYTDTYNQAIKYFKGFKNNASDDFIPWASRALGFCYYRIRNFEQAQMFFFEALQINKDVLNLATCYHFLGRIHGESSNCVESMKYFNRVLSMRASLEPSFIAATYCQMAVLEKQNKENDYSLRKTVQMEYLTKSLDIYQEINEELSILQCRSELFNLKNWADSDECLDILNGYFKYCEDHQIKLKSVGELYVEIGREAFEYYDYDRALQCYLKSIIHFPDNESTHRIMVEIYIRKKNSKLAIEYMKKLLHSINDSRKKVDYLLLTAIQYFIQNDFDLALTYLEQCVLVCEQSDSDTKFTDYIFDFELQRKSELATCRLQIDECSQTTKDFYFFTKAISLSLDLPKLFQSEIISLIKSMNSIFTSNDIEQIEHRMEENNSDLKKFLLEIIFENYIIRNDFHNANDMHYYINALKILCNAMEKRIDGDMELICLPKINHMLKSNFSHDQLEKHIQNLLREAGSRVDMQKDEETLFNKNYLLELKKNKLAKIYSHIGDVYSKTERYEEAQQYYQKSIDYYKTLASLFHLELADLYSKLADIAQKLQESPTTISTLLEESVQAMQYKQHIFN